MARRIKIVKHEHGFTTTILDPTVTIPDPRLTRVYESPPFSASEQEPTEDMYIKRLEDTAKKQYSDEFESSVPPQTIKDESI